MRELTPAAQKRRHQRTALIKMLESEGESILADKLRKCETPLDLVCITCGTRRTVETGCTKRWCPVCANKIAAKKGAKFAHAFELLRWPLFVTLTMRSPESAADGVRQLIKAFKDFRRGKWWKACNIKGGVRGVEITWAQGGWHPHLHLLMDCEWLAINTPRIMPGDSPQIKAIKLKAAQRELTAKWAEHLGQDISICWVKRAKKGTEREVLKYTINPEDLLEMKGRAGEAIRAMEGSRATQGWGTCFGIGKLLEQQEEAEKPKCECEGCQNASYVPAALVMESSAQWVEWERNKAAIASQRAAKENKAREKGRKLAKPIMKELELAERVKAAVVKARGAKVVRW